MTVESILIYASCDQIFGGFGYFWICGAYLFQFAPFSQSSRAQQFTDVCGTVRLMFADSPAAFFEKINSRVFFLIIIHLKLKPIR